MEDNQLDPNLNEDKSPSPSPDKKERNEPTFSRPKSTWEMAKEELEKDNFNQDALNNPDISKENNQKEEGNITKKQVDKDRNDDLIPKEDMSYKKENDNLKTRLHDGQRYITSLNKGKQKAISHLNEFLENGDISEENHQLLLSSLKLDGIKQPEGLEKDEFSTPFVKFRELFSAANNESENYRNATDLTDDEMDDKREAFNAYLRDISSEEQEQLYEELSPYQNNPMALLKRMIKKGEKFIEDGYGEFIKAGGLRKYLKHTSNEMSNMRKKIDMLEKERLKWRGEDMQDFRMQESLPSGAPDDVDPAKQYYYIRDNYHKHSGNR